MSLDGIIYSVASGEMMRSPALESVEAILCTYKLNDTTSTFFQIGRADLTTPNTIVRNPRPLYPGCKHEQLSQFETPTQRVQESFDSR